MNKKFAMSTIGYAIVLVIILGVIMIISAPMLADKYKADNKQTPQPPQPTFEQPQTSHYEYSELKELENRLSSRIDELERRQTSSYTNKYICNIEGNLDDSGLVVPFDNSNPDSKIVFVCEYKK